MSEEYLRLQGEANFQTGDEVLIKRIARDYEKGWGNVWSFDMDRQVGKILIVGDSQGPYGIHLNDNFNYPYFVLQKIKEVKCPEYIKVGAIILKNDKYYIIEHIENNKCYCRTNYNEYLEHINEIIHVSFFV